VTPYYPWPMANGQFPIPNDISTSQHRPTASQTTKITTAGLSLALVFPLPLPRSRRGGLSQAQAQLSQNDGLTDRTLRARVSTQLPRCLRRPCSFRLSCTGQIPHPPPPLIAFSGRRAGWNALRTCGFGRLPLVPPAKWPSGVGHRLPKMAVPDASSG
jgi:hypothetical protein